MYTAAIDLTEISSRIEGATYLRAVSIEDIITNKLETLFGDVNDWLEGLGVE